LFFGADLTRTYNSCYNVLTETNGGLYTRSTSGG
jgi:hypothetical protein